MTTLVHKFGSIPMVSRFFLPNIPIMASSNLDEKSSLLELRTSRTLEDDEIEVSDRSRVSYALLPWIICLIVVSLLKFLDGNQDRSPLSDALLSSSPGNTPSDDGLARMPLEKLKAIMSQTPDEDRIASWSWYYTSGPHVAGRNKSQAEWTRDKWRSFGIDAEIKQYDVYLHYPRSRRLALISPRWSGQGFDTHEVCLEEDALVEDETSRLEDRVPAFLAYAANGNVTAPYVFVNYGTYEDFENLLSIGLDLSGKIALAKYGRNYRGLKIKRAQELNMTGVVLYTDPGDDGPITEANGFDPYPHGPARNPSAIQRGSTFFLSSAPGDPTTMYVK